MVNVSMGPAPCLECKAFDTKWSCIDAEVTNEQVWLVLTARSKRAPPLGIGQHVKAPPPAELAVTMNTSALRWGPLCGACVPGRPREARHERLSVRKHGKSGPGRTVPSHTLVTTGSTERVGGGLRSGWARNSEWSCLLNLGVEPYQTSLPVVVLTDCTHAAAVTIAVSDVACIL